MTSIPLSQLVNVTPGVISAGGQASALVGLLLTNSTRAPIGSTPSFPTAAAVGAYYGLTSGEYVFASGYFAGADNSTIKPGTLKFAQYPNVAVAAYLRGANISGVPLATLQALTGTITLSVDGTARTSGTINLSSAPSLSAIAALLATALGAGITVAYDSLSGAFTITSSTTGASSAITFATDATGGVAAGLGLRSTDGGVTSQGAVAATPAAFMAGVTSSYSTFTTLFKPSTATMLLFAAWNSQQNNDYIYVAWDNDASPLASAPAASSFGAQVKAAGYGGTLAIYDTKLGLNAAFVMGSLASIDFDAENGRTSLAYLTQAGLAADVFDLTSAANLVSNGYNYVGDFGDKYNFLQPGSISGPFLWADSYANQIWLTAGMQLAAVALFASAKNVPYTPAGYAMVEASQQGPITAAVNFGAIKPGVNLSQTQIVELNNAAGKDISATMYQQGWYLSVTPASATVRIARGSPGCTLFYTDGQSINVLNIAAIEVQ